MSWALTLPDRSSATVRSLLVDDRRPGSGTCCGNAVGQLGSPARGCPIDPPGEDLPSRTSYGTARGRRCSSAMGGDQERCTLRRPLGSSDRATALVTRCVTRTQGNRGATVGPMRGGKGHARVKEVLASGRSCCVFGVCDGDRKSTRLN